MKQLFLNGDATTLFFDDKTTLENIVIWVNEKIISGLTNDNNLFNLNEAFSCLATQYHDVIIIKGNEDYVEITIETIVPIKM